MTVNVYRSDDASAPTLNGVAGSLITVLDACLVNGYGAKPAAGWAKAFAGANKAAYRAAAGNQFYLRVDGAGTQDARVVGYETMTDVDTGTGPFPTAAQQSGGLYVRKSNTADATARPWVLIVNDRMAYFSSYPGDTTLNSGNSGTSHGSFVFGDFLSYKSGDAFGAILIGATTASSTGSRLGTQTQTFNASSAGHFMARTHIQTGGSVVSAKAVPGLLSGQNTIGVSGSGIPIYPDPITGGIPLAKIEVIETGIPATRGRMPGIWAPLVGLPGAHLDTFSGTGDLAGKTFLLLNASDAGSPGRIAFETSNTW